MNIQEFNDRVKELGKELLDENYQFSSTDIASTNYGHIDVTEITYRATIFPRTPIGHKTSISGQSVDIEIVFDLIRAEHKKLMAKPSTHIEL